jgi:Recombinase
MLHNRIYRGEIVHNKQSYVGEHEPIIDQLLWDAVQAQLTSNSAQRKASGKAQQPSLLAGMLFDGDGSRMTPSHAVKKGTRYRYYVSRLPITKDRTGYSAGLRLPAAEIEQLVSHRVHRWLLDPGSIYKSTSARLPDASMQQRLVARAADIGKRWPELPVARKRAVLLALIERIEVRVDQIDIRLRPPRLGALLDVAATPIESVTDDEIQTLSVPVRLRRAGREIRMVIDGADPFSERLEPRYIAGKFRNSRYKRSANSRASVPTKTQVSESGAIATMRAAAHAIRENKVTVTAKLTSRANMRWCNIRRPCTQSAVVALTIPIAPATISNVSMAPSPWSGAEADKGLRAASPAIARAQPARAEARARSGRPRRCSFSGLPSVPRTGLACFVLMGCLYRCRE